MSAASTRSGRSEALDKYRVHIRFVGRVVSLRGRNHALGALVRRRRVACALGVARARRAVDQPWRDPNQPAARRADQLLAALTFDQKVAIALGDYAAVASFGVPVADLDRRPERHPRRRHDVAAVGADARRDVRPRPRARVRRGRRAEARGKGFNWWLGPAMDIARTPLAGRQPENLGEDPFLAGETVAEEVGGAKARHVIATLKHYVGEQPGVGAHRVRRCRRPASRAAPGLNVIVAERTLQEIYEAPFKRAIRKAGADAVMCSYNRVNGPQTCENPALLGDLKALRVRRLRRARLHLRGPRPAGGDARRRRRARAPGGAERAHRRDVHLRPGAAGAARRHRPPRRCSRCSTPARSTTRSGPSAPRT